MNLDWTQAFGQQHKESSTRSDVLKPLIWPLWILPTFTCSLLIARAPTVFTWTAMGATLLFGLIYALTYVGCVLRKPDLLRSEHYELSKLAIQQGLFGDSTHGLTEPIQPTTPIISGTLANAESGEEGAQ